MFSLLAQTTAPSTLPATLPAFTPLTLSPFVLLLLAIPVLLLGELLVKKIPALGRSNIPAPVVGGLLIAVLILVVQEIFGPVVVVTSTVSDVAWHWFILPQWNFDAMKSGLAVHQPLLILFFTCIGLNASWAVARAGGIALVIYLGLAALLALIQTVTGVLTALSLGQSGLMGMMCSTVSLMGGFGTATGFAPDFQKAGLDNAKEIGIAAAAFGVIAGGLIAGPMATRLMRGQAVSKPAPAAEHDAAEDLIDEGGFTDDLNNLARFIGPTIIHFVVLLVCLKLGAFFSTFVRAEGTALIKSLGAPADFQLSFPVYMGSMILAMIVRNVHDLLGLKLLTSKHTDLIASFALAWLLSCVMIGLKLTDLLSLAGPMLVILVVQVAVMIAFCWLIVFRVMGRNYEAATMTAGMVGFGLGATSNAVATMRAMAKQFGPSPKAFLIVTVVGAFLIDFVNSFLILTGLNLLK
jgi:glutamate:Na+ symporter, ESS family